MPTAGPYGIVQVDVPGIIGMYQNMQENRIRSMILQKQMQKMERDEQNQTGINAAMRAYYGGGDSASPSAATGASGVSAALGGQAPRDPLAPLPAAPAASQGPPRRSAADREKLFSTLMAIDPQVAVQTMDAFTKMDAATAGQIAQRNTRIMQIASGILQLDPAQRRQAIQQAAPELQQLGIDPQQIAGFDPSDQNLRQLIVQGMDTERIAQFVHPNYMNVNGEVLDTNALARGDQSPVRYRSEYIDTDQGLARRPGGGSVPPTLTDDDIRRLEQGGPPAAPAGGFP